MVRASAALGNTVRIEGTIAAKMAIESRIEATIARSSEYSAPSAEYSHHAQRPNTIDTAANGHAARPSLWPTTTNMTMVATPAMIGNKNHQQVPRTSHGLRDSTCGSITPA